MAKKSSVGKIHKRSLEALGNEEDFGDVELTTKIKKSKGGAEPTPQDYWMRGFEVGFGKTWDKMMPIMMEGVEKQKERIRQKAINETVDGLESVIADRIKDIKSKKLRDVHDVLSKVNEFNQKAKEADKPEDRQKYLNFAEALNWMVIKYGDGKQKT